MTATSATPLIFALALALAASAQDCQLPDFGGTVQLPPQGCSYLSPDDFHVIVDGLPPGTTIDTAGEHTYLLCGGGGGVLGTPCGCGGGGFGLPSPGPAQLTRLGSPGSDFQLDSFFDITFQIDFVGATRGALAGLSGSTTGSTRMQTGTCPSEAACGDCNGDDLLDIIDALFAARAGVGLLSPTAEELDRCNVVGATTPDPAAVVDSRDSLAIA